MAMEDQQAHFKCASAIALLEGCSSIDLPIDIISASNLASLDIRLRRVEAYFNVPLAPPCQAATWDTLAHRIFRLLKSYRTWASGPPYGNVSIAPKDFLQLVSDPNNVSSETLQTLCSDVGYRGFNWNKSLELGNPSDDLSVYSQISCYYAGKSKIRVLTMPFTRSEIYGLLVHISVENGPTIRQPFMPMRPPGIPPGVTVVNCARRHRKPSKHSILSKFAWLKKLAFWRKSRSDDDSSIYSSSSSSSSTIGA